MRKTIYPTQRLSHTVTRHKDYLRLYLRNRLRLARNTELIGKTIVRMCDNLQFYGFHDCKGTTF